MAKLGIGTGIVPDDGTGDSLLDGAVKINSNFSEIYTYFGDGTNLTFTGGVSSQWVTTGVGIHTLSNVGIGTTNPTSKLTVIGDANITGVVTATSFVGDGSNLTGISSFSGDYTDLTNTPVNLSDFSNDVGFITSFNDVNYWTETSVGIHTLSNVGIGTTNPTSKLTVIGDARVTGIVTIGPASITLNGISNIINVGSGITINGSTGTINATSINLGGTTLTGAAVTSITAGSGISVDQSTGNVTISATGGGGGGIGEPVNDIDGIFSHVSAASTITQNITFDITNAGASNSYVISVIPHITIGVGVAVTVGAGKAMIIDVLNLAGLTTSL